MIRIFFPKTKLKKSIEQTEDVSEITESGADSDLEESLLGSLEFPTDIDAESTSEDIEFPLIAETEQHDDDRAWYVVHCYSGYENKVRHNLEQRIESMGMKDKIFDVVVPTEEEIEVREGKRRTVERRVFPGYILVNMLLSEEVLVRSTKYSRSNRLCWNGEQSHTSAH